MMVNLDYDFLLRAVCVAPPSSRRLPGDDGAVMASRMGWAARTVPSG